MAESFTFFGKFGDVCEVLDEGRRKELVYALAMYGMYGETVEMPMDIVPLFIALKDDIDNSKSARKRGAKGGRPRKKPEVSKNKKPEVSETEEPLVSENAKPNTVQYSTVQVRKENDLKEKSEPSRRKRFVKPTVDDVSAYIAEKGYRGVDARRFCDYYESKGWVVGKSPMKDWKAAVRTWAGNAARRGGQTVSPASYVSSDTTSWGGDLA